jgi:hypothetical protein
MKSCTFATEMVLHVLAYNLKRVINIVGIKPLIAAAHRLPPSCRQSPSQRFYTNKTRSGPSRLNSSAQNELPGPLSNSNSSAVDVRPRIALRCGKRPNRSMMSLCASAYFVSSGSPNAEMSSRLRACAPAFS